MAFNVIPLSSGHIKDLAGRRFGRLSVVGFVGKNNQNAALWGCVCDCGGTTVIPTGELLRSGQDSDGRVRRGVRSCGCLQPDMAVETHTTHGMTGTPEYQAWADMISRCENPDAGEFKRYGARGISVCAAWRSSFERFLADIGLRPEGLTLDRIDVNGNYEPDNIRWATQTTQMRNRRCNRYLEYKGERMTLAEASERSGIDKGTIRGRLRRGWPDHRIFDPT